MVSHQLSRIPRSPRNVPLEFGLPTGSILSSVTSRIPEIETHNRMFFGEAIPATNNKVYDPSKLKCSICCESKPFGDFHRDARYTWRHQRRYECAVCEKKQAAARKSKRAA